MTGAFRSEDADEVAFAVARETCDVRGMADALLRMYERLLARGGCPWEETPLAAMDVLLLACRVALEAGDAARAVSYVTAYRQISIACHRKMWLDAAKWGGVALYRTGDYEGALQQFEVFGAPGDVTPSDDAETKIYRGNALFRLGRRDEAQEAYIAAMKLSGDERVAAHNLALTLGPQMKTGEASLDGQLAAHAWADELEEPVPREIPELSLSETFDLPIFINCRDRLVCLQKLVTWLLAAGYRNVYLIDNASTYPPLLAYYQEIIQQPGVHLLTLSRNFGHRALWQARILEYLRIDTPFVYTDPDVVPIEACPTGLVARLYQILRRYPYLDKVGTLLEVNDLGAAYAHYAHDVETCRRVPIEEELFFAPCDTTFALYAPHARYTLGMAMRTGGRLLLRHLPWYLDPAHLPEDEAYYVAHADQSSTFAKNLKQEKF